VIPIPDTSRTAALQVAQHLGIKYREGFIKNRYIHRTFIMPDQRLREAGVRMKLSPLPEAVAGKRVVVVDDSIVRGTTTGPEIDLLREAGAKEIHLRISCPPTKHPCFYGIDFPDPKELIANQMGSVDAIRKFLEIDSLAYLSVDGMLKAMDKPKNFCAACFTGEYPVDYDAEFEKTAMEGKRKG